MLKSNLLAVSVAVAILAVVGCSKSTDEAENMSETEAVTETVDNSQMVDAATAEGEKAETIEASESASIEVNDENTPVDEDQDY